jgi:hypothetical protein
LLIQRPADPLQFIASALSELHQKPTQHITLDKILDVTHPSSPSVFSIARSAASEPVSKPVRSNLHI